MSDEVINEMQEQEAEETEARVMDILTNDPSDPVQLEGYDVYVMFQRPAFKEKYRHRAWASKKLKEFGYTDAEAEDPDLAYFVRSWGAVNSHVVKLFYKSDTGSHTLGGEKYAEYSFNAETDLDYGSVFEKYTIEEVYNNNQPEDSFVAAGIIAYTRWVEKFTLTGDDIKNS